MQISQRNREENTVYSFWTPSLPDTDTKQDSQSVQAGAWHLFCFLCLQQKHYRQYLTAASVPVLSLALMFQACWWGRAFSKAGVFIQVGEKKKDSNNFTKLRFRTSSVLSPIQFRFNFQNLDLISKHIVMQNQI